MGWNLVKLAYLEFIKKHINNVLENLECRKDTNPLHISQLCIYYYADVLSAVVSEVQLEDGQMYMKAITENKDGKIIL